MNCLACGEKIVLSPIDSYKIYKLYHCHVCDLMFWDPLKNAPSDWYEADYQLSTELTTFSLPRIAWEHEQLLRAKPVPGGSLLDIGCGAGDFLSHARKAGYSVTGVDFSPKFIEIARRRFGFKELYAQTWQDFIAQRPDNRYDVITFFGFLEHIDNLTGFLQSVRPLLKDGGYVAGHVPNRERWRFAFLWDDWDYPPNHVTRWNRQALANLFTDSGFSILTIKTQPLYSRFFGYNGWLVAQKLGIEKLVVSLAKRLVGRGEGVRVTGGEA